MLKTPKPLAASHADLLEFSIISLIEKLSPDSSENDKAIETAARRESYRSGGDGIIAFVREVLHMEPAPYQDDIFRMFAKYRRVAAYGPHGLGKSTMAAACVLWLIGCFDVDVKVGTTASNWRQLTTFLWPEIHKWARKADWQVVGRTMRPDVELLSMQIKTENALAFAAASNNHEALEGAHATVMVYIFDEAKAIPVPTWDALEGAFSTAGGDTDALAFALAISTPGDASGRFHDICTRRPGYEDWHTRHVSVLEAIDAGRVSKEWVDQRRRQWGEKSALFQNRVLGEFADSSDDGVIPLSWAEAAVARWYERGGKGEEREPVAWGVDVAYKGEDKTVIARKRGLVVEHIESHAKEDTMQTTGRVTMQAERTAKIGVDVIGVGAGVFDRLRELGYTGARPINVSHAAKDISGRPLTDKSGKIKFLNLRAYLWWMLRDALDPDNPDAIALPPTEGDALIGDLTAPKYMITSTGAIQIESKDDIRERLGRSTDFADAVALAIYVGRQRKPIMV